jgi:hypothetical protein
MELFIHIRKVRLKKIGGILSVTYYDMNRKILDSWDLDAIKWKYINPDTTRDIIQKGVCK